MFGKLGLILGTMAEALLGLVIAVVFSPLLLVTLLRAQKHGTAIFFE